jgi:hypothetical protein
MFTILRYLSSITRGALRVSLLGIFLIGGLTLSDGRLINVHQDYAFCGASCGMAAIGVATPGSSPSEAFAKNIRFGGSPYLQLAGGRNFDRTENPLNSTGDDSVNGCGKGRVRDSQTHQCRGPADSASTYSAIRRYWLLGGAVQ